MLFDSANFTSGLFKNRFEFLINLFVAGDMSHVMRKPVLHRHISRTLTAQLKNAFVFAK